MVELQLPKLTTWVRFPSPAPTVDLVHVYLSYDRLNYNDGAVAQLGERRVRNAKAGSSILLRSTI